MLGCASELQRMHLLIARSKKEDRNKWNNRKNADSAATETSHWSLLYIMKPGTDDLTIGMAGKLMGTV
mgnify:CR=1 FL=1